MAALGLDAGILYMRQLLQDSNTSFPAASDTEYARTINDRYMWIYKVHERRVTSVTAVAAISQVVHLNTSETAFIYPEIESAYVDYQSGPDTPLERMKWNDLYAIIELDRTTTGTPRAYAAQRLYGSTEKWSFLLYPLNNATGVMKAYVRVMPTALSGSTAPELDDATAYALYRMAAADLAGTSVQRPELVDAIMGPVPDDLKGKWMAERKRDDPKRRPETSVLG